MTFPGLSVADPLGPSGAQVAGATADRRDSALDAALAAIGNALPEHPTDEQLLAAAKCRGLMFGYDARWSATEWRSIATEETVVLPVVNPESLRISRTWRHASKHDGIIEGYGKTLLLEHKTTSESDIADPNSTYWRRLAIDAQVSKYALDNWQLGRKLDGALYDVILKPGIRPKEIAKADRSEIQFKGTYCGFEVALDGGVPERETPELYELRLRRDALDRADRYFARRVIHRLDSELEEYAGELWAIGKEIQRARAKRLHFRNSASCLMYGRPCEYLGICSGFDDPASDRWQRAENPHEELDLPADRGYAGGILTHSSISVFQACRRKYDLRYNLGLRRRDEDDGEALYIGRLLHLALAAWWIQQTGVAHGNTSRDDAGNGLASSATVAS